MKQVEINKKFEQERRRKKIKHQTKCSIQQTKFNAPFKEKCADFFAPHVETQLKGTITYRKGLTKLHALFRLEVSCSLYYTFPTSFLPFLHSLLFLTEKYCTILTHFSYFHRPALKSTTSTKKSHNAMYTVHSGAKKFDNKLPSYSFYPIFYNF